MSMLKSAWLRSTSSGGLWAGYLLAVFVTAAATIFRSAFPHVLAETPYLAFYPAVLAAAAFGGFGPGVLATAVSALSVDLLFDATPGWIDAGDPVVLGRLAIFLAGGVGVSVIAGVKRAAQTRERRQARELAELAELTDLGYLLIRDEQDRITRWSEGCTRLYGFTAEQALGRISHELLRTEFPEPLTEIQATLQRTGRWEGELVHHRADGRAVFVVSLWVLHRGSKDAPARVLQLSNDITEQKRIQASLSESEQRLRATFDNAALGILEVDERDCVIAANQRVCQLLGYEREQLLGLSVHELTAPEDRTRSDELNAELHAGQRQQLDYDKRYLRRDGSRLWVHVTVSPIRDAAGRHLRSVGTVEDISQRRAAEEALRESERKYRIVADHTYDWEFWLSPEGRFLHNSPSCQDVTGYAAEEFVADPELLARIVHPDDQPAYHAHRDSSIEGCLTREVEFGIIRRDGTVRWISHACQAVYDADGSFLGIRGSNRDVTERKQFEQELAEARLSAERARATAAEQANQAKDHFLAALSHELRTPLTPVLAAVSLLQDDGHLADDTREALEIIRRNVKLQARLIDDLLDVSRITCGKVELKRRPVEIAGILRRAIEVCRPNLEAGRLRLDVDLREPPQLVNADAGRLQQVFWNLLSNAIKFTPPGGSIRVTARRDADQALVEVADSGVGIEGHLLSRIFNPFDQGEAKPGSPSGGLGLGLAISKALVEQHGGTISACSAGPERGATFSVRLPLHDLAQPRPEPPSRAAQAAQTTAPRLDGPLRILLVEDHADTARILARLLRSDGHEVTTAVDMAAALREAEQRDFDLLISDLGLPDGSGVDLVRELHSRGKRFPAIAMTGYGQEEDLRRTRAAGFVAHLTKPIEVQHLQSAMASVFAADGD